MEFIIVGDTEKFDDCLVKVLGKISKQEAEAKLKAFVEAPTENDKRLAERHSNFKIKAIEDEACWWNDPFLCN